MKKITSVVFDIGGVLIDWNPRHLFRKVFENEEEMEWFLANVCTYEWNVQQDGGKLFSVATAELQQKFPEYSDKIALYYGRWEEMLDGEIIGTVEIFRRLKSAGMPLYALSNWSHEAFPVAYNRYGFMKEFDGLVVSGYEKLLKPDHAIYRVLMDRYSINPAESVYIDDNKPNAIAATELGFNAIHFSSPDQLRGELALLGLEV
ncbi:MAG: HAD family phosphatase [Bacteroidales bacterium]|jgi:2-haloacid dehalogenase|nr:HAD family phosphatase [Bacteroidales bacterium]MDX9927411.1 HAD family phosphatase [Bacteroidales bacterium]HNX83634.1 HAD family phosphatase [Bacteroidales bacterium]HOC48293.1 HAD family phosphatase [Bacteroidales bacterium]HPS97453.1 HAD family phosphatase [Bacteroidales bacterium]